MAALSGRTWCLLLMIPLLSQLVSARDIGTGFYLPERDLLGSFTGGATIFKDGVPDECINVQKQKETRNDKTFYKNSGSFYQSIGVSSSLDASLEGKFTMGVSLSSASKSISGSSYDVSGTSINVFSVTDYVEMTQDCLNDLPFAKNFQEDLEKLPLKIEDPSLLRNWYRYKSFVEKYASHVLVKVNRGARMVQSTFAKSSKDYSENDFTIKGCIDLAKVPTQAGQLNVKACASYSKEEIQRASKLSTSDKLTLLGGTAETRSKLQGERTKELIAKFLEEAETDPNPIFFRFRSIWDLLKIRFVGSNEDNYIRAMNIQAYYSGLKDFGCTRKTDGSVVLREFLRTYVGNMPHYICRLPPTGCRSGDDCHIGGAGSVCYCYGSGCVDSRSVDVPSSKIKEKRVIRKSSSGSYNAGVNKSCYYAIGVYCKCNTGWGGDPKTVWPTSERLSDDKSLWEVHAKFLKRSRDATCKGSDSGDNPEGPEEQG